MMRSVLEQRDFARCQGDDGPLGVGTLTDTVRAAGALALAGAVEGVDLEHFDTPDRLDGVADLGLRGLGAHLEGVDALLDEVVALLGDDRSDDDVARILHQEAAFSSVLASGSVEGAVGVPAGSTSLVKMIHSLQSTS